jgi:hypothetical protein
MRDKPLISPCLWLEWLETFAGSVMSGSLPLVVADVSLVSSLPFWGLAFFTFRLDGLAMVRFWPRRGLGKGMALFSLPARLDFLFCVDRISAE